MFRSGCVMIALTVSMAMSNSAAASVHIWTVESGGNGHAYEAFLVSGITWDDANAASQLASYNGVAGHLATVTDGVEHYVVSSYIMDLFFLERVWLGGYQSDPAAAPAEGWAWVTGETWEYTTWALGDPDDGGVPNSESHLAMICPDPQGPNPDWLDFNGDVSSSMISGYVVEYDLPLACPGNTNADNEVNVDDLLAVINAWGKCVNPSSCPADLAPAGPPMGNDLVNVDDLLAVINAWGRCR